MFIGEWYGDEFDGWFHNMMDFSQGISAGKGADIVCVYNIWIAW